MDFTGRLVRDPLLGDEWIPIIPVVLTNASFEIPARMLVDTGAHLTLLPFSFGLALGLKADGEEPITGNAVGGGTVPYLLRTITIGIAGHIVVARIGWLLDDATPPLLGRLDIFDAFNFDFRQSERKLLVTPRG